MYCFLRGSAICPSSRDALRPDPKEKGCPGLPIRRVSLFRKGGGEKDWALLGYARRPAPRGE